MSSINEEKKQLPGIVVEDNSNGVQLEDLPNKTTVTPPAIINKQTSYFTLDVENLSHEVVIQSGRCGGKVVEKKTILHKINAQFVSGQCYALMGPSGAGKTTLLNVLGGNNNNPALKLNKQQLPEQYGDLCSFIPQHDILYPGLSPRQALHYSASLSLNENKSPEEIKAVVDDLIDILHLTQCQDTPVGDENTRGVSGGERKRVSIGTELVINPRILFVDEPTSGLDSKMAEDVISLLKDLTGRGQGQIVICTIHQPSWTVFNKFDCLVMLHLGRVVYKGNVNQVNNYFSSINYQSPEFENPLDYYMRLLQTEAADHFTDLWLKHEEKSQLKSQENNDVKQIQDSTSTEKSTKVIESFSLTGHLKEVNSSWHLFKVLFARNVHDTLKDKQKFIGSLMMKLVIGVLMGMVFLDQARDDRNSAIGTTSGALFFLILSAVMDTSFKNVIEFPSIRPLIAREYKNRVFPFFPYFMAQFLNTAWVDLTSSLFYIPAYFMIGLAATAEQFFTFLLILMLLTLCGTSFGLLIGSIVKDMKEANAYMLPFLLPLLMYSGFFIPYENIVTPFQAIYFASFFQYDGMEYFEATNLDPDEVTQNFIILAVFPVVMAILCFLGMRNALVKSTQVT